MCEVKYRTRHDQRQNGNSEHCRQRGEEDSYFQEDNIILLPRQHYSLQRRETISSWVQRASIDYLGALCIEYKAIS